jgi:hypothetical protein
VLQLWERGRAFSPARRSLSLLEQATDPDERALLGSLSVGGGDAMLLRLRSLTFGERIDARTSCPSCGETLEFALSCDALAQADGTAHSARTAWQRFEWQAWQVSFRLPRLVDMAELDMAWPAAALRRELIDRCIAEVRCEGVLADPRQMPPLLEAAVTDQMQSLDPGAELDLGMECPGCRHGWSAAFDIGAYLWQELSTHARRLLREVDVLARTYGWREADILALSSQRRRSYIEMVDA